MSIKEGLIVLFPFLLQALDRTKDQLDRRENEAVYLIHIILSFVPYTKSKQFVHKESWG